MRPGAEIIWLYDEETRQILLMEKPDSFAKVMRGLGKELWNNIDTNEYIKGKENHGINNNLSIIDVDYKIADIVSH